MGVLVFERRKETDRRKSAHRCHEKTNSNLACSASIGKYELLNGIQKISEPLTKRINVQVSSVNDFGTQFDVNGVLVVDHMNVPKKKMKLQELQEKCHTSQTWS